MLLIAHRGNISGPNPLQENSPDYILGAIASGFDVEVDVWILDGVISLGHEAPGLFNVSKDFLLDIGPKAWFHCKNLEALYFFNTAVPHLKHFWHQEDDYTLTSSGHIWTYPDKPVTDKSIIVSVNQRVQVALHCYGICSDYVSDIAKHTGR